MKIERIQDIKKRFDREWLLIDVASLDRTTTTPMTGKLIAHSPHRDVVYKKLASRRQVKSPLIQFSEDRLPKGYAAAF